MQLSFNLYELFDEYIFDFWENNNEKFAVGI